MKYLAGFFLALVILAFLGEVVFAEHPPLGPRVALRFASYPEYELCKTVPAALNPELLPLWLSVLEAPERDLHRQVGDALARAKGLGMQGLDQSVTDRLRKSFEEADHPVVRRSLASALVALDDVKAADRLWEKSQSDYQLALIVEPALGQWKYQPAIDRALSRLENPTIPSALKRLAIALLAKAQEEKARDPLLAMVLSLKAPADLRLAAAKAVSEIFSEGLSRPARELNERKRTDDSLAGLLAVGLLNQHTDAESLALLRELARDNLTAVQGLALKRLGQLDQKEVAKFALDSELAREFSVEHRDANVRMALIESLYSIQEVKAIAVLRMFLDDPHPDNRAAAGDALHDLARKNEKFHQAVEQQLLLALKESSWRTLERAAIVAGGLDVETSSELLIPLLTHERREVAVASAWALKELAIPETLPVVLKKLQENLETQYDFDTKAGLATFEKAQEQSQHLNEQLGLMKYLPAEPVLRRWIPFPNPSRRINHPVARATGIWAVGLIHQDQPNPPLTAELVSRLNAINAMFNSEPEIIGEASAYAIGMMRDKSGLADLRKHASRGSAKRSVNDAAAWAVGHITGEPLPLSDPIPLPRPRWFLEPLEKKLEKK